MTTTKTSRRSFAGGEITPEMYGRLDNAKNQTGLALCRNAIVLPHGPVTKRSGDYFVNHTRLQGANVRTVPFVFSATQSMVLELGGGYMRFHTMGASLLETNKAINTISQANPGVMGVTAHGWVAGDVVFVSGAGGMDAINGRFVKVAAPVNAGNFALQNADGTPLDTSAFSAYTAGGTVARVYTITTPWNAADLFELKITQDSDVITFAHNGYVTQELRRLGATNWTLTAASLGALIGTPTGIGASPVYGTGWPANASSKNFYYQITAVSADGLDESLGIVSPLVQNDLLLPGAINNISWTAPAGVTSPTYRVYKATGAPTRLMGFIGEVVSTAFIDDNIVPDYSRNPPTGSIDLTSVGKRPAAVTYFEQRRVFGGSIDVPQGVYMTRTGTENNLSISKPTQSGDALQFKMKAQQRNAIRHLLPLGNLLALTEGGLWRIASANGEALLPSNVSAKVQSYDGASHVTPLLTGTAAVFVETNGKRVRDIGYSNEQQTYTTDDRSIMAPHLFDDWTIVDATFARTPDRVAWFVRSDGVLLSLSYVPEHQVFAWAQHVTDGKYKSCCTVPEGGIDVTYFVVERVLNGQTVRVIERQAPRKFTTQADAFFVDCGVTYTGAATTNLRAPHLAGRTCVALADGAVHRDVVVAADGLATIDFPASTIHLGLPFATDLQTMPLAVEAAAAAGSGLVKNVGYVYLLVHRTGVFTVGADAGSLRAPQFRTTENFDTPPMLKSEEIDMLIEGDWTTAGQVWLRSEDPVPFTLSAITMQVSLGG